MVTDISELLTRYHIQSETLTLKATKSRHIDDPYATVAILRPPRDTGIRAAPDGFGMGYAGLRQLQHIKSSPINVLRTDKVFIEGLSEDNNMIATIIMLTQNPDLQMIAEGVETEA